MMNKGFKGSCKFTAHFPKSHAMIHTRCDGVTPHTRYDGHTSSLISSCCRMLPVGTYNASLSLKISFFNWIIDPWALPLFRLEKSGTQDLREQSNAFSGTGRHRFIPNLVSAFTLGSRYHNSISETTQQWRSIAQVSHHPASLQNVTLSSLLLDK